MKDKLWKEGDLVVLASGGPVMTVIRQTDTTRCQWFVNNQTHEQDFVTNALVKAPPSGTPGGKDTPQ